MLSLALLLLTVEVTHSYSFAGAVVAASGLSRGVAAPLLGALVDHRGQSRLLLGVLLVHLLAVGGFVFVVRTSGPSALLFVLASVAGAATPPVPACFRAIVPDILSVADRDRTYALDAIAAELIWIAGPLAVSLAIVISGPTAAVGCCAVSTAVGVGWFASHRESRAWRGGSAGDRTRLLALRSSQLRLVLMTAWLSGVSWGAFSVVLPRLAEQTGSAGAAGALLASVSLGSIVVGLGLAGRIARIPVRRRYPGLLALTALAAVPVGVGRPLWLLMIACFVAGAPLAISAACQYSLVGETATRAAVTEAFTWATAVVGFGIAVGVALGGVLVDLGDPRFALAFVVLAPMAAALVAWRRL